MADKTGIEWTDATWNPIVGCSIVSPGCTNCYAMSQAARIEAMAVGKPTHYAGTTVRSKAGAVWTGKVMMAPESILMQPTRWQRPRRIFVNSMGDLFHESIPDEWIDRVFAVMAMAPQHTFQVLTKRAKRMRKWVGDPDDGYGHINTYHRVLDRAEHMIDGDALADFVAPPWPLPNVWLGVSAERQQEAYDRIPDLLATPAAVRFVSAEPLLGSIKFGSALEKLDWVIVGGESGPDARPMHPDWARSIRDQCARYGTAFFFKQWGSWSPSTMVEAITGGVRSRAIDANGQTPGSPDDMDSSLLALQENPGAYQFMRFVGRKRSGRLLDAAVHHYFPPKRRSS